MATHRPIPLAFIFNVYAHIVGGYLGIYIYMFIFLAPPLLLLIYAQYQNPIAYPVPFGPFLIPSLPPSDALQFIVIIVAGHSHYLAYWTGAFISSVRSKMTVRSLS